MHLGKWICPIKNGAENRPALTHLSVNSQEHSRLRRASFKASWQLMSLGPGRAAAVYAETTLTASPIAHFLTDVCSFAIPAGEPSSFSNFQTQISQGWRGSPSLSLSLSSILLSLATAVIYNVIHRKHNVSRSFFSFRFLIYHWAVFHLRAYLLGSCVAINFSHLQNSHINFQQLLRECIVSIVNNTRDNGSGEET